jgi:hypothetical protein
VAIKYGHPMTFEQLRAEARLCSKKRLKAIYQEAAEEVMREITALRYGADCERFP